MREWITAWIGDWSFHPASHFEKWVSASGGFLGILTVAWISHSALGAVGAGLMLASVGASAVLLFAVPHGALSQPWPVLGGHTVSAAIGVTCALHIADPAVAAAAAVGCAIGAMYYLHCVHPPGGATALIAVIGGDTVGQLGYGYVLAPVLLNAVAILAVAVVVNLPFAWRRYPALWARPRAAGGNEEEPHIPHSDLVYALTQIDSFIDISEHDLQRIYNLALRRTEGSRARSSAAVAAPDPAPERGR